MNYSLVLIDEEGHQALSLFNKPFGCDFKTLAYYSLADKLELRGVYRYFVTKFNDIHSSFGRLMADKILKEDYEITDFYSAFTKVGVGGIVTCSVRFIKDSNDYALYMNDMYANEYFISKNLANNLIIVEV
jgi:hypothetical protein